MKKKIAITLAAALIAATSALAADTPAAPASDPAAPGLAAKTTVLCCESLTAADRPMWQRILSLGLAPAEIHDKSAVSMGIPGSMPDIRATMDKNPAAGEIVGGAVAMFRPDVISIRTRCTDAQGAEILAKYERKTGVMEYVFADAKTAAAAKAAARTLGTNSRF